MTRKIFCVIILSVFLASCATVPTSAPPPQEVVVKVQATDPTKVSVQEEKKDRVNKSMEVPNPEGRLSQLSFISKDKAFVKIFSGLSVADVTRLWNDIVVLENNTGIRDVNLFINSMYSILDDVPPVFCNVKDKFPSLFLHTLLISISS